VNYQKKSLISLQFPLKKTVKTTIKLILFIEFFSDFTTFIEIEGFRIKTSGINEEEVFSIVFL